MRKASRNGGYERTKKQNEQIHQLHSMCIPFDAALLHGRASVEGRGSRRRREGAVTKAVAAGQESGWGAFSGGYKWGGGGESVRGRGAAAVLLKAQRRGCSSMGLPDYPVGRLGRGGAWKRRALRAAPAQNHRTALHYGGGAPFAAVDYGTAAAGERVRKTGQQTPGARRTPRRRDRRTGSALPLQGPGEQVQ